MENEVTNQESNNEVQYIGFWTRLLAYLLDSMILFIPGLLIQFALGSNYIDIFNAQTLDEMTSANSTSNDFLYWLLMLILSFMYFVISWTKYDGQTVGKRMLGIKIVKENLDPIDQKTAMMRFLGFMISSLTTCFFAFGFLWVFFDKKKQSLHDKLAKTIVIKSEKQANLPLAAVLVLIYVIGMCVFSGMIFTKSYKLALEEAEEKNVQETNINEINLNKIRK